MSNLLLILLVVIAGFLVYAVSIYNRLIKLKVNCENAWSQIDVQLKRRHDLIPNLVETVKGYAGHEQETFERVVQARNSAIATPDTDLAQKAAAESNLSGALRQIFALSENYPELKANENFAQLQEEITSTENKISFARQYYNDSVGEFNTAISQVPNNIVAGFGNFPPREFFELDAAESTAVQSPPKVSF